MKKNCLMIAVTFSVLFVLGFLSGILPVSAHIPVFEVTPVPGVKIFLPVILKNPVVVKNPAPPTPTFTAAPTKASTKIPTKVPTISPTKAPTITATRVPTTSPTKIPTATSQPGTSFTFLSWGDTKSGTSVLASLSNQAKKLNPVFTIYQGDLEEAGFTASGIATWATALNGNSSNGTFEITFPVRGNHDTSNVSGWQAYFTDEANANRVGARNYGELSKNLTYSFEYGNSIFVAIDVPGDAPRITSGQITWLDNTLTAAESKNLTHAFIYFHGPIYPVDSHTTCTTRTCATDPQVVSLVKVLNKHSIVSATFHGHEHIEAYVHMDSSRVPEITHPFEQFITGSAGAGPSSCSKTFRYDYCGPYAGLATITVSDRTYTVKIYQVNNTNPVKTYTFTK
jgi:3',5'-cyclic AMP phosphodiesterase CpdA